MKVRSFFLFLLITAFSYVNAQRLTGVWNGSNKPSAFYATPIKVMLEFSVYNDSLITGVNHLYYTNNRYEHHKLNGWFSKKDSLLYVDEVGIISYHTGLLETVDEGKYKLHVSRQQDKWNLQGEWKSNRLIFFMHPKVQVRFEKDIEKDSIPAVTPDVKSTTTNPPDPVRDSIAVLNRAEDIQLVIEVSNTDRDSIKVDVYDNGEIDNDTISVYLNNLLIVSHQKISLTPISVYLTLNESVPFNKLKMVAENLGTIPPNTGLMIITTRKKRYEVSLSSTLNKTAVVEFFLKE